ncbi:prepilin-type N-terminal cleavage/methylation domain-containing protein [Roseateles violae]|uniref:Prepilin-type N-terminal cleavage/methylation domain-containing protein n=1 Tax=Roseateles violae TaxID=3058042 RepID=A0ABT8DWV3_9BURK|nr:prepilin-type N-terminal cleavage/methylation domain-containing protein [Pelomonas sp. PFR6]MDN3920972.1 prepilin-type N-terminal cleavage/methylation domain-containing protein [Pelomonas sp. PFR6]
MRLRRQALPRSRGFTLLELLVVLTIAALSIGFVLPAASRWIAAVQERGWRDDLRAALQGLPVAAFRQGAVLELDAPALRALLPDLPAELEFSLEQPLRYSAMGVASGGRLSVRSKPGGRAEVWQIEAVTGRVLP